VKDHIISWCRVSGIVFDPFMGSGTTGKVDKELNLDFISVEQVKKFFDFSSQRIKDASCGFF